MKKYFQVTYWLDIVSKDPADYKRYIKLEAENEIDALKKAAISMLRKDAQSTIDWVNSLEGTVKEVLGELCELVNEVVEISEEEFNAIEPVSEEYVVGCNKQEKVCESRNEDGSCGAHDSCRWQIL